MMYLLICLRPQGRRHYVFGLSVRLCVHASVRLAQRRNSLTGLPSISCFHSRHRHYQLSLNFMKFTRHFVCVIPLQNDSYNDELG